jgi:hypothetical protein
MGIANQRVALDSWRRTRRSCAVAGERRLGADDDPVEQPLRLVGRVADRQLDLGVEAEERVVEPAQAFVGERKLEPVGALEPGLAADAHDRAAHLGRQRPAADRHPQLGRVAGRVAVHRTAPVSGSR